MAEDLQEKMQLQILNRVKVIIKMRIHLNLALFQVFYSGFFIIIPNAENKVIKKIADDITNSIKTEKQTGWTNDQLDFFQGLYFVFEKEIEKISLKSIYNELQLNIGKEKKNKILPARFDKI